MGTMTFLTKEELKEAGIKFICVDTPAFAVNIQKTAIMSAKFWETKEQALEELSKVKILVVFDTEKVYEDITHTSSKHTYDGVTLRYYDGIKKGEWMKIQDNVKDTKDRIYSFDFDLTYFS